MALAASPAPFVEAGIAISVIVLGLAVALRWQWPVASAMALVGVFAIFHGHAHGAEMPVDAAGMQYGLGFMLATALLHGVGIGFGLGIAWLTGAGAFAFGKPFLTSAHGHPSLPLLGELPLASAALFDLGVYITVVGATMLMLSVLGAASKEPPARSVP